MNKSAVKGISNNLLLDFDEKNINMETTSTQTVSTPEEQRMHELLQALHKHIAAITQLNDKIGTEQDGKKLRKKLVSEKQQAMQTAKEIHVQLLELEGNPKLRAGKMLRV